MSVNGFCSIAWGFMRISLIHPAACAAGIDLHIYEGCRVPGNVISGQHAMVTESVWRQV